LPKINLDEEILVFLDQTGYQNKCNSGKQWYKPELTKNRIVRNPDWLKINAFGSYSPNGNSILQFRKTSKTLDMMTFLCETRRVNVDDEKTAYELEILLKRCYHIQKQIVYKHENATYYKLEIKDYLTKKKIHEIKKKLHLFGNDFIFLLDDYYSLIYDLIWSNISDKEISNVRILKKVHDKQERNQKEIQLAKDLITELESKYWSEKFSNEKDIVLILDNATIHQAILTKTIATHLKINLVYLPKYASDLNSIERLWYAIKHELSTEYIEDANYLKDQFQVYFKKYTQTDSLANEFMQKFII
jgi:transposase